jgi:VWFA-related protein
MGVILLRCFLLAFFSGSLAAAQTPDARQGPTNPPFPSPAVFSVSTTLIQTDAVVTDKKGHQVTGLKPEDFEVLLDGKPQQISNFSYVRLDSPTVNQPALSRDAAGNPVPSGAPVSVIRPEDVRRSVVLLVDDLNLSFFSMATVRRVLKNFVEKQMQPGDLVAIWETGRINSVFQQFTADKRALLTAVNSLRYNSVARGSLDLSAPTQLSLGPPGAASPNGSSIGQDGALPPGAGTGLTAGASHPRDSGLPREEREYLQANLTAGTLTTIDELLDELRQLGGRKAVVLLSDGLDLFPDPNRMLMLTSDYRELQNAFRRLIDKANRSGTVVYTLDARGLMAPSGGASRGLGAALATSQAGLIQLAGYTGGLAMVNGNGFDLALDRVEEDQKGYYLIGFKAPAGINAESLPKVDYHLIRVNVNQKGLSARSRTGFWGETDEASKPKYTSAQQQMRSALFSLFNQAGLHPRLAAFYSPTRSGSPLVRNLLYIDPREMKFATDTAGRSKAALDVMILAEGTSSQSQWGLSRHIEVDIPPEKFEMIKQQGLLFRLDVSAKDAGPYQVRVAVRDANSSAIGSAGEYLLIPDLKKQHLALTTPRMDESAAPAKDQFGDAATVLRQFHPGAKLSLAFLIETDGRQLRSATPQNFEASIELFSSDKSILKSPVKVTPLPGQNLFFARTDLVLVSELAAGQYYLVALVTDRSGKRLRKATSWTDFQVVE